METPLIVSTVLLSSFFVVYGLYFFLDTDFRTERSSRKVIAASLLLIPLYGIVEFGFNTTQEIIPLLLLATSGLMMLYGYREQYVEVVR